MPYILVFIGSLLVDLIPFIGPPAWTVMIFCQLAFGLQIWPVLVIGVTGSTLGRYLFSLYIPNLSARYLKPESNNDLQFLGNQLGANGWKSMLFIFLYTLIPLPTTTLFTATGIARLRPIKIIPPFFAGKFASDALMVITGEYAGENADAILHGMISWQTISGTALGLLLFGALLFIDWRTLLVTKKLKVRFSIFK